MDSKFKKREQARENYRPRSVKWLLVAEAPPRDLTRYFYFDHCDAHDYLFLETIHVIYRNEFRGISAPRKKGGEGIDGSKPASDVLRKWKHRFLCQFRKDGFHLIDAVESPISKEDSRRCDSIVRGNLSDLVSRMNTLVTDDTRVILIKDSVCALKDQLKAQGFQVINECSIVPFPNQHWQPGFRREMHKLLQPHLGQARKKKPLEDLPQCPHPDR